MTFVAHPAQGSLPFSAVDAINLMRAVTIAWGAASASKAMGTKAPAFLDELHRQGFTVTPLSPAEVQTVQSMQTDFEESDPVEQSL